MDDFDQARALNLEGSSQFNQRLDAEWTTLNAIREMLGIAHKGKISPTYSQALDVGRIIAPQLYDTDSSLLGRDIEPELVREYRQKANAESQVRGRPVSPLDVLDEDIERQQSLAATTGKTDLIQKNLNRLQRIRPHFQPRKYTEDKLILRDFHMVRRDLPEPPIEDNEARDFKATTDRVVRIRMLHPDPPEHSFGADLIYEQYWDDKQMARLAVIQYKIWDGKVLYLSQARNLEDQMKKMEHLFCETGKCEAFKNSARKGAYRLPYCVPFLRPTNKLQNPDSRFISRGLHVPICAAFKAVTETRHGNKKIESKIIRNEAVSHKVFEEMFNANILGSRWFTYEEIKNLYHDHKIWEAEERIVLHVQEFG